LNFNIISLTSTSFLSSFLPSGFIDINLQNSHYHSTLFNCARHGHIKALRVVLGYPEIHVNQTTAEKTTALMVAVQRGHQECVEMLAKAGADIGMLDSRGRSVIMIAAQQGHTAPLKFLLNHTQGRGVNRTQQSPDDVILVKAGGLGAGQAAADFTSGRVIVNDEKALKMAAARGRRASSLGLLPGTPSSPGTERGVEMSLASRNTALHMAAQNGHEGCVKELLQWDANLDCFNADNTTPLMLACREGHSQIVQILLDGGADVNLLDLNQCTALDIAKEEARSLRQMEGHVICVRLLKEVGYGHDGRESDFTVLSRVLDPKTFNLHKLLTAVRFYKVEPHSVLSQARISDDLKQVLLEEGVLLGLVDYMIAEGYPWNETVTSSLKPEAGAVYTLNGNYYECQILCGQLLIELHKTHHERVAVLAPKLWARMFTQFCHPAHESGSSRTGSGGGGKSSRRLSDHDGSHMGGNYPRSNTTGSSNQTLPWDAMVLNIFYKVVRELLVPPHGMGQQLLEFLGNDHVIANQGHHRLGSLKKRSCVDRLKLWMVVNILLQLQHYFFNFVIIPSTLMSFL
jgi:ankyrin repeat protein